MPYYIDIDCSACLSKFKIDVANYTNKKISFSCKKCGNKISYFVPPGIDGLSAPKAEISTKKVKKVKEEIKKEKKENLNPVKSAASVSPEKLKLKLPSLFKRKADKDRINEEPAKTSGMEYSINAPVSKTAAESEKQSPQAARNIPAETGSESVEKEPRPFPVIGPSEKRVSAKSGSRKPLDFLHRDAGQAFPGKGESTGFQPDKPRKNARSSTARPVLNNDNEKSLVHIPKPGMPFIAQLSTPSFYKAGSARRKDYSFIVTEILRFRNALGRTNIPDTLSAYKMAAVSTNNQDFTEPEFASVNEPAPAVPFVVEKQYESQPLPPHAQMQPTSADIEKEAIEFERSIQAESQYGFPPGSGDQDREMEFVTPISPRDSQIAAKPSIPAINSKIYIPLNGNIDFEQKRSGVADRGDPVNANTNIEDANLINPEIEVIEDSYASGEQPALEQPGFQLNTSQIPPPFAGLEQRPLTDSRTLPFNGAGVAQQAYPAGDQQGFSAPAANPAYSPLQQSYQQAPPPPPPFLRETDSFQSAETLQQPQQYEQLGKPENMEVPPYMQNQAATQRIPRYQQGNFQQDGHDSFSQNNVNAAPIQTTEQSEVSQPSIQNFNDIPSPSRQPGIPVQTPLIPIPPPSVTSAPQTGIQKKSATIDEDDGEQFGPSNFGLDF